jgi:GMP synthase-like glutamine amidotransferase
MNNGHPNQASRCFRVLIDDFFAKVRAKNPQLATQLVVVHPRNLLELPPEDCDFYLSSGGPGGPFDHDADSWLTGWRSWVDRLVEKNLVRGPKAPGLLGVCYSFELLIEHFKIAKMSLRSRRKFGVMPVYMTEAGMNHSLTSPFGDRLFAFENRNWEALDPDERRLRELGGAILAQESRDGQSKGAGLMAVDFAPGVIGAQFHPEADKPGVVAWLQKREQAEAFIEAYGQVTYRRMLDTLDNPQRLARTFTVFIPGWLSRRFNHMAADRGWNLLDEPSVDIPLFAGDAPLAASVAFPSLLPPTIHHPKPQFDFDDDGAASVPGFRDSSPPLSESLRPLQEELDPGALGESV